MQNASERRSTSLTMLQPGAFDRASTSDGVLKIALNDIIPNRNQVRTEFNDRTIFELAQSIEEHGLLEPIVVRKSPTVGLETNSAKTMYEIIAGERRFRAFKLLERPTIPAIVRSADDSKMRVLALIENVQREDLSILEKAQAISELKLQFENVEQIAKTVGISRSLAFLYAKIGDAPAGFQSLIKDRNLDLRRSETILGVADKIRKTQNPAKADEFLKRLQGSDLTEKSIQDIAEKSGGIVPKKASKPQAIDRDGFWQSGANHGLKLSATKGRPLNKKEQDNFIKHTKNFFNAIGAKRVHVEF